MLVVDTSVRFRNNFVIMNMSELIPKLTDQEK